jgi:hypothetical protein
MFLDNDINYVVKFNNGTYYAGGFSSGETTELKNAQKYVFDWQIVKDHYLQMYLNGNDDLTYEVIKVKTLYEIVN